MGAFELEWRRRTGRKEADRFISWKPVGYHEMNVCSKDGFFVTVPDGWSARRESMVLLGVLLPLVYTYLVGDVKGDDPTSLSVRRVQAYLDAKF